MKEIDVIGLGSVSYVDNDLITFEDGLYGFENLKKYLPIPLEEESDRMLILQSVEDKHISFILMNPFLFIGDYEPSISQSDMDAINCKNEKDISYYVICALKDSIENSTMNLKCPIAVNAINRKGIQLILDDGRYDFRHKVGDLHLIKEDVKC